LQDESPRTSNYQLRAVEILQTSENLQLLIVPANFYESGPLAHASANGLL
jgi:hypothetical protein